MSASSKQKPREKSEHENTLEHQIPISLYIIHIFIYTIFFIKYRAI